MGLPPVPPRSNLSMSTNDCMPMKHLTDPRAESISFSKVYINSIGPLSLRSASTWECCILRRTWITPAFPVFDVSVDWVGRSLRTPFSTWRGNGRAAISQAELELEGGLRRQSHNLSSAVLAYPRVGIWSWVREVFANRPRSLLDATEYDRRTASHLSRKHGEISGCQG